MKRYLRSMIALGAASVAVLGISSNARASFEIDLYADAARTIFLSAVVDNGAGDSNPIVGQINVSGVDLTNLNSDVSATGVRFSALNATSNASTPGTVGVLTVGGTIAGTGSIYILNSATDYTFPLGPNYRVDSSFSGTFTRVGVGTNESYTSYFNDNNVLRATQAATGTLLFANSGTGSYSNTAAPPLLTSGSPPYSLTNFSGLTVVSATALGFNGTTTTVRVVPEPGSVALMLVGGSFLLANKIRRRRAA